MSLYMASADSNASAKMRELILLPKAKTDALLSTNMAQNITACLLVSYCASTK